MTNKRVKIFRLYWIVALLFAAILLQAQEPLVVEPGFISALVSPSLLRDAGHQLSIDSVQSDAYRQRFKGAESPYLTFGFDPARWWMYFKIDNRESTVKTYILRLNRKNFDELHMYQKTPGEPVKGIGELGEMQDNDRFFLVNGYYIALRLAPGVNEFWAQTSNRIGSMYLGLSVHSQENYGVFSRQSSLVYGIFLGVVLLSIFFSSALFFYYRNPFYLIYIAYVISILLREAYYNSADFDLFPIFQRHCTTMLIAATYAALYRRFLQVEHFSKTFDFLLKCYSWAAFIGAMAVWILAEMEQSMILKYIFLTANVLNLIFTGLAFFLTLRLFRKQFPARVLLIGTLPVAFAFAIISLRTMSLIPNYPLLQFVVEGGFILEMLVFTVAFSRWYRAVDLERDVLRLKISVEQQEIQLAIQKAEQRVKDRIARDLHDDVAASMSGIRILSQVAHRQFAEKAPEAVPLLEQITRSAQATLDSIGDIIWAIKPHPDYLNDMADRMREHAIKVLDLQDLNYHLDIPRSLPAIELDVEARRNVYLIFKEAVNNILKHSKSTHIEIGLYMEKTQLSLRIKDNGVGFDPATVKHGQGLDNMIRRAEDIGAEINISAKQGAGTSVVFTLPLGKKPVL